MADFATAWEKLRSVFQKEPCATILRGLKEVGIRAAQLAGDDEIKAFWKGMRVEQPQESYSAVRLDHGHGPELLAACACHGKFIDDITGLPLPLVLRMAAWRKELACF